MRVNVMEKTRPEPNAKNRIDEATERAVVDLAIEYPAAGPASASKRLGKRGVCISQAGLRRVWARQDLPASNMGRKALENEARRVSF